MRAELDRCERCRSAAPPGDSDEFLLWEALIDERGRVAGVICAGCVTGEERRSMNDGSQDGRWIWV